MTGTSFSAGPSMAGYLWQVGLALIEGLRTPELKKIEIETDDDVVLRRAGGELYAAVQAKHSLDPGSLTTSSPELWKTLRVWSEDAKKPSTQRAKTLVLLTTHSVAANSTLKALQEGVKKSVPEFSALRKDLDTIAKNAGNKELVSSYQAWMSLSESRKDELLQRAVVRDAQLPLNEMKAQLDAMLVDRGIRKTRVVAFRDELLGWFSGLVAERIGKNGIAILKDELNDRYADLVDHFTPFDLPDTAGSLQHPALEEELAANPTYVRQLKLIDAREPIVTEAVHSHHRATKQRDDWMEMELVSALKLIQFDRDLTNKWKQARAFALQTGGQHVQVGLAILQECMKYRGAGLGSNVYTHVSCGSYHMLADVPQLGWHPSYATLLQEQSQANSKQNPKPTANVGANKTTAKVGAKTNAAKVSAKTKATKKKQQTKTAARTKTAPKSAGGKK